MSERRIRICKLLQADPRLDWEERETGYDACRFYGFEPVGAFPSPIPHSAFRIPHSADCIQLTQIGSSIKRPYFFIFL